MSWRRLEDALKTFLQDVLKSSWKRLEDVLNTYGQGKYIGLDQDVLKTSSEGEWLKRIHSSKSRRLLKTKTKDVFKTSSARMYVCWDYIILRIVARILVPWLMWSVFGISCRSVHIYDLSPQIENSFRKLKIWSHLLKKSLIENVIFCAVNSTLNRIFAETISLNRFSFINRLIEFDNKCIRNKLWKYEHFSCRRKFFENSTTP